MKPAKRAILPLLILIVAADLSPAGDTPAKVDNPVYTAWAKFKVGSSAEFRFGAPGAARKGSLFKARMTLKTVTPDAVTLDIVAYDYEHGGMMHSQTIPAKVDPGDIKPGVADDVIAMGKTIHCKKYEAHGSVTGDTGSGTMTIDLSDDVVGIVQLQTKEGTTPVAVLVTASTPLAVDTPKVDNPLYTAWAKRAVGSSVALQVENYSSADTQPSDATKSSGALVLKEKKPDSIVLESSATFGTRHRTETTTIPAKVDTSAATEVGTDDVTAMGKSFNCKRYDVLPAVSGNSGPALGTIWVSDDIVGGMIKFDQQSPIDCETTITVTAMESK